MDGAIDIKLMLTLAGMLVSVVSAAAIAKRELKLLADQAHDIEIRLRKLDQRVDKLENVVDLAGMSSPDTMERRHREVEHLRVEVDQLKREVMK